MDKKKIAVLLTQDNLYTNGSIQQPYFFMEVLKRTSFQPVFMSSSNCEGKEFMGYKVEPLAVGSHWNEYCMILMVCHMIEDQSSTKVLEELVGSYGIHIVQMLCGNHHIFNAEDVIFNRDKVIPLLYNRFVTEVWQFKMHMYSASYISIMLNAPVREIPYVWDSDIIQKYAHEKKLTIANASSYGDDSKINIVIMEPNLNVTKNCLTPLLIASHFYRQFPDKLGKVLLFCGEHLAKTKPFMHFTRYLSFPQSMIEVYPRIIFPEVLSQIKQKNPVFIAHQMLNDQNYINLEILHYNYPLLHNSESLRGYGHYYNDEDLPATTSMLLECMEARTANWQKSTGVSALLSQHSCRNFCNIQAYEEIISNMVRTPPLLPQEPYRMSLDEILHQEKQLEVPLLEVSEQEPILPLPPPPPLDQQQLEAPPPPLPPPPPLGNSPSMLNDLFTPKLNSNSTPPSQASHFDLLRKLVGNMSNVVIYKGSEYDDFIKKVGAASRAKVVTIDDLGSIPLLMTSSPDIILVPARKYEDVKYAKSLAPMVLVVHGERAPELSDTLIKSPATSTGAWKLLPESTATMRFLCMDQQAPLVQDIMS